MSIFGIILIIVTEFLTTDFTDNTDGMILQKHDNSRVAACQTVGCQMITKPEKNAPQSHEPAGLQHLRCCSGIASLAGLAPVATARPRGTFGTPTAMTTFGPGIVFDQPVTVTAPIGGVELLLTIADAIGPNITEVLNTRSLTYTLDLRHRAPDPEHAHRRPLATVPGRRVVGGSPSAPSSRCS